jgi:hypothetical protein
MSGFVEKKNGFDTTTGESSLLLQYTPIQGRKLFMKINCEEVKVKIFV